LLVDEWVRHSSIHWSAVFKFPTGVVMTDVHLVEHVVPVVGEVGHSTGEQLGEDQPVNLDLPASVSAGYGQLER
jgi:hypothetical protein